VAGVVQTIDGVLTYDGYSLADLKAALVEWRAAVSALATSQSYTIGTRTLTRVNLAEARAMIAYLANGISVLASGATAGGVTARRIVPRDL
jgi:hypothetical protein